MKIEPYCSNDGEENDNVEGCQEVCRNLVGLDSHAISHASPKLPLRKVEGYGFSSAIIFVIALFGNSDPHHDFAGLAARRLLIAFESTYCPNHCNANWHGNGGWRCTCAL